MEGKEIKLASGEESQLDAVMQQALQCARVSDWKATWIKAGDGGRVLSVVMEPRKDVPAEV